MTLNLQLPTLKLRGLYRMQVRRHGKLIAEREWWDNLITDAGLEGLGEAKALFRYCMVGTGNTAPVVGDTTLQAQVASLDYNASGGTSSGGVDTGSPRFGWERRTYPFAQGAVTGNIAEVGVGWTTTNVFSRSLVSPAVTLLSIDQLTVTYEIRIYIPVQGTDDVTGSVVIDGTTHNYTIRPLYAATTARMQINFGWQSNLLGLQATTRSWCGPMVGLSAGSNAGAQVYGAPAVLGPITDTFLRQTSGGTASPQTGGGSGFAYFSSGISNSAYVPNSKECKFTTTWGISNGNEASGIQGFSFTGLFGTYQCVFASTTISKDNTKQLDMVWKQSWARH